MVGSVGLSFSPLPEGTGLSWDGPTCLEFALYSYLEEQEIEFVREWTVPGTRYRLDAYDPQTKIGYEADGHPNHFTKKGRERDEMRDERILAGGDVVQIIRFTYDDLKYWL